VIESAGSTHEPYFKLIAVQMARPPMCYLLAQARLVRFCSIADVGNVPFSESCFEPCLHPLEAGVSLAVKRPKRQSVQFVVYGVF